MPTKDRKRIRALRRKGLSIRDVSEQTGYSDFTVEHHTGDIAADARPATNRARATVPPPWLEAARKLLSEGLTRNEIAGRLKIAKSSVYRMLAKFGAKGQD